MAGTRCLDGFPRPGQRSVPEAWFEGLVVWVASKGWEEFKRPVVEQYPRARLRGKAAADRQVSDPITNGLRLLGMENELFLMCGRKKFGHLPRPIRGGGAGGKVPVLRNPTMPAMARGVDRGTHGQTRTCHPCGSPRHIAWGALLAGISGFCPHARWCRVMTINYDKRNYWSICYLQKSKFFESALFSEFRYIGVDGGMCEIT